MGSPVQKKPILSRPSGRADRKQDYDNLIPYTVWATLSVVFV